MAGIYSYLKTATLGKLPIGPNLDFLKKHQLRHGVLWVVNCSVSLYLNDAHMCDAWFQRITLPDASHMPVRCDFAGVPETSLDAFSCGRLSRHSYLQVRVDDLPILTSAFLPAWTYDAQTWYDTGHLWATGFWLELVDIWSDV